MSKISVKSRIAVLSTVLAVVLATASATSVFAASTTTTQKPAPAFSAAMEKAWGPQIRDLQIDRTFYDTLRSHPAELSSSNSSSQNQQYLDQYAFALKQAEAIVRSGIPSAVASVNVTKWSSRNLTAQQNLAMYLHMIRGLRTKLAAS